MLFFTRIAIDASMSIYQFLVAVRVGGSENLTNSNGDVTSHLMGLFYRTIKLIEVGIKPCYVFDGKPPPMKGGELAKRAAAREANAAAAKKAREDGDVDAAEKFERRDNKVTKEMTAGCKELLRLMGVPVVEAPCEAEAQCAELCKADLVYATATEDMDALTFGTKRLLRQLWSGATSSAAKKGLRPREFTLAVALEELAMTMEQFVDMCILCGCDYSSGIPGVGPMTALKLIREHGDLATAVAVMRKNPKSKVPEDFDVEELRRMFYAPEVTAAKDVTLKWKEPDVEGIVKFMVGQEFEETKIRTGIARMTKAKKTSNQGRMDSFFKKVEAPNAKDLAKKREDDKAKAKGKKRGASSSAGGKAKKKGKK